MLLLDDRAKGCEMEVLEGASRVAFERFEVDLLTGELWKAGLRVRISTQPFTVLAALLERPGEIVTREELQQKLWDKDTNVDFERALTGAINKIRDALGDSAENPKYVETLPKRGYRFVASVSVVARTARTVVAAVDVSHQSEEALVHEALAVAHTSLTVQPEQVFEKQSPASLGQSETSSWTFREIVLSALSVVLLAVFLLAVLTRRESGAILEVEQLTHESPFSAGPPNPENLSSLATDGGRIFATTLVDGRPQVAAVSVGTGELAQVPLPQELASVLITDISRDGTKLLLLNRLNSSSEQPLWVVPAAGGSAFRIGNILAHSATWMPDGANILYASANDLLVYHVADGSSNTMTTLTGRAFWPRWSPDGKLLRFTLLDPMTHGTSLWEIESGKKGAHPVADLANTHSSACCGVWTADGKAYVFVGSRERGTDLWELTRGIGSKLTQLTHGPIRYFSPVAARSGHRIFFLGWDKTIGLQRFDRASRRFLPDRPFLRNATRVEYSQDGQWVAWTDPDGGLWRARASDGSDRLQLTPPNIEVFVAHWAPDGTRLALMAKKPGMVWSIYVEDASGGEMKPMLREDRNAADPTWSPDGNQLVFGREPDLMGKENGLHQIYLLDIKNQKSTALPNSDGLFSPRWSPDGRWIAALSLDQKQVMLFDTETRSWRSLAVTSAADPVWSRDAKALFVHAYLSDKQPILRISVPSGEVQVVADLSEVSGQETKNYFFSGLTPGGDPLVLPSIGTSNLYSIDLDR